MPTSARSWKYYEDNVLYCILLQVAFQLKKTSDPHDKAFHLTSKQINNLMP